MADRYWFGGTGSWTTSATTVWAASAPISFTASSSGTTLTTVGNPSLVVGMTIRNAAGTSLGTISSGSGNSWVVSIGGTNASQTMYATTTGASVPTATDAVFFNTPYAQTVTLTGALNCLDFTISAGPVTLSSTGTINIAGSMSISSGTVWSATGNMTFTATSAKTITTNSVTINSSFILNGVGGSWQLIDNLTLGTARTFTLTNGTIDLNNNTLTTGLFSSSNTNTRTIAFGTGNITITAGNASIWNTDTSTNLTVTGTPVVNTTYSGSTATRNLYVGNAAPPSEVNSISFNVTGGTDTVVMYGAGMRDVNFTGFAGTWSATGGTKTLYGSLTLSTGMTLAANIGTITFAATSGTKTITSNGKTIDGAVTFNGVGGTFQLQDALTTGSTRTVTLTNGTIDLNNNTLTTGLFSSSNTNTRTIAFGTGNITVTSTGTVWTTATVTGLTTTGTQVVNVTNSGSTAITISSGALSESNSISFNIKAGTYSLTFLSISGYTAKNVDFTGFSGTLGITGACTVFGSLTLSASMTVTSSSNIMTFSGTSGAGGVSSLNTNGTTFNTPITVNGANTVLRLLSNVTNGTSTSGGGSSRVLTLTQGTLDLNGFSFYTGAFSSSNSNTRTLSFGSTGALYLAGAGTNWNTATVTGLTVTGTPTVYLNTNTVNTVTLTPGTPSEANTVSFIFLADANSPGFSLTSGNYRSLDFTNYTGQLQNTAITVYGDYILGSGMSFSGLTNATTFASTSATTRSINCNTRSIPFPIIFNGVGGSWSLSGNMTVINTMTWTNGNINLNNYILSIVNLTATATATFTFGTGYVVGYSTGTINLGSGITLATANSIFAPGTTGGTYTFSGGAVSTGNPMVLYCAKMGSGTGVTVVASHTGDIDTTGFTSGAVNITNSAKIYNATLTDGSFTLNNYITFSTGSADTTINTTGVTFTAVNCSIYFRPTTGRTIKLLNNITLNTSSTVGYSSSIGLSSTGTLDLNGYTITSAVISASSGIIKMSSGSIVIVGNDFTNYNSSVWGTQCDFADTTGSINFTASTSKTMDVTTSTTLPPVIAVSTGGFYLASSINLNPIYLTSIQNSGGGTVYFGIGQTTYIIGSFLLSNCALRGVNLGVGTGTIYTLSKSSGTVSVTGLTIYNSTATGGASWQAYTSNSNVDGGGNTGWIFTAPSTGPGGAALIFFL